MSPEDINLSEDYLKDEENMIEAKVDISCVGGNDGGDFIRRAMSKLFDDSVLKERNWEGKKGKQPFKTLRAADLLLGALAISQKVTDEKKGVQLIKNYMKNSTERIRQRNKN